MDSFPIYLHQEFQRLLKECKSTDHFISFCLENRLGIPIIGCVPIYRMKFLTTLGVFDENYLGFYTGNWQCYILQKYMVVLINQYNNSMQKDVTSYFIIRLLNSFPQVVFPSIVTPISKHIQWNFMLDVIEFFLPNINISHKVNKLFIFYKSAPQFRYLVL